MTCSRPLGPFASAACRESLAARPSCASWSRRRCVNLAALWSFAAIGILLGASVEAQTGAAQSQSASGSDDPNAPTIYKNARIYTNDPSQPWAEVMIVQGGKIMAVGGKQLMTAYILEKHFSRVVDLHGQFVMPGFNDAHVHLGGAGADMLSVRLNGAASIEELQKRLAAAVAAHPEGEWITGAGWDHTLWPARKFPTRYDLDSVSPKNPVFLTHVSGHVAVANSLALKLAEIDKNTENPAGGQIERDSTGEPTGMLEEESAMQLVARKIPDPTAEQRRRGIELVLA
ncbi:MAG TPA: amidohydrolase family protein, partial [Candidatus Acidoferrum sp.]|nr:amidohydrolase family protein [Candidatus Acidoferrum sp.]